jgi:HlyD family secretion protein
MVPSAAAPTSAPPAPRRKPGSKLWLFAGLGLLVLVLAGVAIRQRGGERPIAVTTERAVVKTLVQVVSATGRIQPEVEVKISAEVAGEIIELPVVEGQTVQRGDLLVRIRPDFYLAQREQQLAAVAGARARVVQNEAQAEKAAQDFAQVEALFRRGLVAETEFLAARTALRVAEANLEAARAETLRAEGSLRQAEDQLAKTLIYAPMDGTVSVLQAQRGERVVATGQFAGTEIMRLADLDAMEVRVSVNENDVVNVKVGDVARLRVDAFREREFRGIVREIASTARTTGQGTQDEVTNFEVRIRVVDPGVRLRPGMSATADIETKTVVDVVAVPIQSVTVRTLEEGKTADELREERAREAARERGESAAAVTDERRQRDRERADRERLRRVVFVREGDRVRQREVETGILDHTHIEIVSGLAEGEEIVTGSFAAITRQLKDGSRVLVSRSGAARTARAAGN